MKNRHIHFPLVKGYNRKGIVIWKKKNPEIADIDKAARVVTEHGQVVKDTTLEKRWAEQRQATSTRN